METTHTYKVIKAGEIVAQAAEYGTACSLAKAYGAEVWDSKPDGTPNLRRWSPMLVPKTRKVRHVLVNTDAEVMDANAAGMDAYDSGIGRFDNPLPADNTELRTAWDDGWLSARGAKKARK